MAEENSLKQVSPIEIDEVAFGIRYQPQWMIRDQLGAIVDDVLRSTPFNPDVFPGSRSADTKHLLVNRDTGDRLEISERDCVLCMKIGSRDLSRVQTLATNFQEFVISRLIKAGLDEALRYGFLVRLAECSRAITTSPTSRYLSAESGPVTEMDLSFSRRMPTEGAAMKARVNDFVNIIYLVTQSENGEVHLGLDYQEYFEPALRKAQLGSKRFDRFVKVGLSYYVREYQPWLAELQRTQAA